MDFKKDRSVIGVGGGEAVLDSNLTKRLSEFLSGSGEGGGGNGAQSVTINLQVGEEQLASIITNLDRRGFRTAA